VDLGLQISDCGFGNADFGLRNADCGFGNADCGLRIADFVIGDKHSEYKFLAFHETSAETLQNAT
jgi:hypothetical protein